MAYHGAVLAGLQDATGWDARDAAIVVGTSAGAASGAELRAGIAPHDMAARRAAAHFSADGEQRLRRLGPPPQDPPRTVRVDEDRARAAFRRLLWQAALWPGSVRPGVLVSVAMSPGTLSAGWLTRQSEWLNGGHDWPARPFWPCAVDLDTGQRVVFGRTGAPAATPGEAVAASCAIPGVNAPVEIGGGVYIDGGGYSPTNADVLCGEQLDLVVVVAPMSAVPGAARDRRDAALRDACRTILLAEVAALRWRGTAVAVVEPDAGDVRAMGHIVGIDVLDEARCATVVRRVRASTARRARAGALPGLELLSGALDEAA